MEKTADRASGETKSKEAATATGAGTVPKNKQRAKPKSGTVPLPAGSEPARGDSDEKRCSKQVEETKASVSVGHLFFGAKRDKTPGIEAV